MPTGETRLFPIIGDPVVYSKSPEWLTHSFAARGYDGACVPMQVSERDLEQVMRGLSLIPNIDGLLVTKPHKLKAFTYCATSSQTSRLLEAVSVMRRNADGSWHGDMLDGLAFVRAQKDQGAELRGARALLVGAGGAGSAIAVALIESGVTQLLVHDTDSARVTWLIDRLSGISRGRTIASPPDPRGCDLVCNATPMGMTDGDPLPVATSLIEPFAFVGDVVAGRGETAFLRDARAKGCKTANGDQMVAAVQEMMVDFMLRAQALPP